MIRKVSLFTRDGREHPISITDKALRQLRNKLGDGRGDEIVVQNAAGATIFRAPISQIRTIIQVHN